MFYKLQCSAPVARVHVGQARQALPQDLQHERLPLLLPVLPEHVPQAAAPPAILCCLLRVRRGAGGAVVPEHQPLCNASLNPASRTLGLQQGRGSFRPFAKAQQPKNRHQKLCTYQPPHWSPVTARAWCGCIRSIRAAMKAVRRRQIHQVKSAASHPEPCVQVMGPQSAG